MYMKEVLQFDVKQVPRIRVRRGVLVDAVVRPPVTNNCNKFSEYNTSPKFFNGCQYTYTLMHLI